MRSTLESSSQKTYPSGLFRFAWLAPLLLALLFNFNVLQNGLGWDDDIIIPNISSPDRWLSIFLSDRENSASKEAVYYYRPMVRVSYILDNKIWGERPFGYHLSVLMAHLFNTLMVFLLARALVKARAENEVEDRAKSEGKNSLADFLNLNLNLDLKLVLFPLFVSSLFAVHPVHSEAVAWIAGRNDVLCTAFMLSSFLLYVRFHRSGTRWMFGTSMFLFFLALLTKEMAIGLAILFPIYELLARSPQTGSLLRRLTLRGIPPLLILAVYFGLRMANSMTPLDIPDGSEASPGPSSWAIIVKAIGATGLYLKLMLFPYPHSPFIAVLPDTGLFLVFSCLGIFLLIGGFLYALLRGEVITGTGLGWTALLLAPAIAVAIFSPATTLAAERYVYGPSAGFLMVGIWWIIQGMERIPIASHRLPRLGLVTGITLMMALVFLWGWQTWNRNTIWRDPLTFWETAVRTAPLAGFPHAELGTQYVRLGRYTEGEREFRTAITQSPNIQARINALSNLGDLYSEQERYEDSTVILQMAADLAPKNDGIQWHLAKLYFRMSIRTGPSSLDGSLVTDYDPDLFQKGERHLKRALELRPLIQLYFEAGTIYMSFGLWQEAEAYYTTVLNATADLNTRFGILARERLDMLKSGSLPVL